MGFRDKHSFDKRYNESRKIKIRYPNRLPLIVERDNNSRITKIDKNKFLVPNDLTVGQFVYVIRKRIKLNQNEALFIYVNNILPSTNILLSQLYETNKNIDGFLYITYSGENTFG
jgi:GABA(A) receptor-associated protein